MDGDIDEVSPERKKAIIIMDLHEAWHTGFLCKGHRPWAIRSDRVLF